MTFARRGSAQNCPLNSLETLPDVVAPCCEPSCGDSMVRPCITNQNRGGLLGGHRRPTVVWPHTLHV